MQPDQAQTQVEAYAKAHGLSVGDAYHQIQEMCEQHREVWEFGRVAGLDQAAGHLDSIGSEWAERAAEELRELVAHTLATKET
jgi:hypothetical protein